MYSKEIKVKLTEEILEMIRNYIRRGSELLELPLDEHSTTPEQNKSYSLQYEQPIRWIKLSVNKILLFDGECDNERRFKHNIDFLMFCNKNVGNTLHLEGLTTYEPCYNMTYFTDAVGIHIPDK